MTELNELFEQILYSERKFKARNDELRLGIMYMYMHMHMYSTVTMSHVYCVRCLLFYLQ